MLHNVIRRPLAVVSTATVLMLSVACEGDEILGPPDGGRCVAGRLTPDQTVTGRLGATSCVLWSPWTYDLVPADAWTLEARANTAYIIDLIPTDTLGGATPLGAALAAYARNAAGDVGLETGSDFAFGTNGRNQELVLTTDAARTFSIRAEAFSPTDSGSYAIRVSSCPIRTLAFDTTASGIDSRLGCVARGLHAGATSRVSFLSYTNAEVGSTSVRYRRSAGTGGVRGYYAGYGADFADVQSASFRMSAIANDFTFTRNLTRLGRTTLALSVHADSGATLEATVIAPIAALRAPTSH